MTSKTSVDLSIEDGEVVILGTEYAGEMKKGVFTIMNYLMPKRGVLSMHCSATADPATGRSSILFGLSGTGKTTLSADPKRQLIGDDEHCWTRRRHLQHRGRLLRQGDRPDPRERARHLPGPPLRRRAGERRPRRRVAPSTSTTRAITENTRGAYPIEFIPQRQDPLRRRPPDRRDLPDLRRLRRAPAGEQAHAGAGDVPLHQRLHGEGRRHRGRRHRAAGDVLALLRRPVPGLAPDASTPSCSPRR